MSDIARQAPGRGRLGRRPPRPRLLTPAQERAAKRAGGWGLSLFGAGVNLIIAVFAVALLLFVLRLAILDLFGSIEAGGFGEQVRGWLDSLDVTALIVAGIGTLVLAGGLMALAVVVSTRLLRDAEVEPARRITWWGCLAGTVLQAVLSLATSALMALLGLLTGVVSLGIIVLIYVVASTGFAALVGWLAGPRYWLSRSRSFAKLRSNPVAGL